MALSRTTLVFCIAVIFAICGLRMFLFHDGESDLTPFEAEQDVATFSIVAYDPEAREWGIAVQSKFLAVGSVVPWAQADTGAIATQAWANPTYGPRGLAMLAEGQAAQEVLRRLTKSDKHRHRRQVGIIDAKGRPATFTGESCLDWAGGRTGENYAIQGNILAGPQVVEAMAEAFEKFDGDLGEQMLAALAAGQEAGGDRRGKQSAALLIVRKRAGYSGLNDRYRDLRVDDHPEPIKELHRLYSLHKQTFPPPGQAFPPVPEARQAVE